MSEVSNVQLSLRRAFRIGYFAFTSVVVAAIVLIAAVYLNGDRSLLRLIDLPGGTLLAVLVVSFGFCVPLFFGFWSMVGSAVLGIGFRQPTIYENLRGN